MTIEYKLIGGLENQLTDITTGEPVIGGYLYSFKATAHTTPKNIAKISAPSVGADFYTNPLELDSSGAIPTPYVMYFADDELYCLVLTTSAQNPTLPPDAGNIVRTWDNFGPAQHVTPQDEGIAFTNFVIGGDFSYYLQREFITGSLNTPAKKIANNNWWFFRDNDTSIDNIEFIALPQGGDSYITQGNPEFYLSFNCTAGGSGQANYSKTIYQVYNDISEFENKAVTFAIYARSSLSTEMHVTYDQYFGTGGSPSASVSTTIGEFNLTADWVRYTAAAIEIPSIAAKVFGSNNDAEGRLSIRVPTNALSHIEIVLVQLNLGTIVPDYTYQSQEKEAIEQKAVALPDLPAKPFHESQYLSVLSNSTGGYSLLGSPPVGSSMWWWTDTAPDGWMEMRGEYRRVAVYNRLFNVLGSDYGHQYCTASVATDTVTVTGKENGNVTDATTGTSGFAVNVTQQGTAGLPEIFTVQTLAASLLASGEYFEFGALSNGLSDIPFYIYIVINNNVIDPAIGGKTGIPLYLDDTDSEDEVAAKLSAIMNPLYFKIPDTRGYFIRAWDHGLGADPDAASRTNRGDGTTGDNVGTRQLDEFKSHQHLYDFTFNGPAPDVASGTDLQSDIQQLTVAAGGNETRGKNIYGMQIIKY